MYTIGEVSEKVGLKAHTIRYYEKEGLIFNINKNNSGVRVFTDYDISWIEMICCLKNTGMSIDNIKHIVELIKLGDVSIENRKEIFLKHKEELQKKMDELSIYMEKIDAKINYYETLESNKN